MEILYGKTQTQGGRMWHIVKYLPHKDWGNRSLCGRRLVEPFLPFTYLENLCHTCIRVKNKMGLHEKEGE